MPNITRGDRMAGLVSYLVSDGRHNEHTEPHLVAGDHALMAWYDDAELSDDNAKAIARHLDRPRTARHIDVKGGHVWHASLSLRAEEGIRTDQEWAAIAQDFVSAMGFDDNDGTKAPCRWVAIRHGLSQAGNDHVHIAVNLVREDGTKASTHLDYQRAQNAARALEVKYGLEQLESTKGERATRGYSPAEQARVEERSALMAQRKYEQHAAQIGGEQPEWHRLDPKERQARITAEVRLNAPRNDLARSVPAAAGASENEAEFVRRLRRSGVLVRPRFAEGTTDVITGYSVASRPANGERAIWYGGGQMGRDLTLPRLREGWPDTAAGATDAAAEWQAAKRGRRPVAPGREMREPDPELWQRHTEEVAQLREQLRAVPLDDRDTWSTVARQTAGAFAAWSNAAEKTPGDLAEASDALAKSAQTRPLLMNGDLPKITRAVPRFIPDDELAVLMDAVRTLECPFQRGALLIARWSGARRSEIRMLTLDCLDAYPDGTPRLRLPASKNYAERTVPLTTEAADAIRILQDLRRDQTDRPLPGNHNERPTRRLFVRQGRVLSNAYLFDDALLTACTTANLLDGAGKPTVSAHRFRHTVGTQLAERGARLQTIMSVLGHKSVQMALVYAHVSDPAVLDDYRCVLGEDATIAGPSATAVRNRELGPETVDWLKDNFFRTEPELGHCLRLPSEGPCECDLFLTCAKFITTPKYAPRLRDRYTTELDLADRARERGWAHEVERHEATARRVCQLLSDLGEPITTNDTPPAERAHDDEPRT